MALCLCLRNKRGVEKKRGRHVRDVRSMDVIIARTLPSSESVRVSEPKEHRVTFVSEEKNERPLAVNENPPSEMSLSSSQPVIATSHVPLPPPIITEKPPKTVRKTAETIPSPSSMQVFSQWILVVLHTKKLEDQLRWVGFPCKTYQSL